MYPEQILYLNVRPDPAAQMNCVVFVLPQQELEAIDQREWIYDHRIVTTELQGVRIEGGNAIVYVAHEDHTYRGAADRRRAAVRASYAQILDEALAKMTPAFGEEYKRTSDALPSTLLIEDVLDPERPNPWARAGFVYRPQAQLRGDQANRTADRQ